MTEEKKQDEFLRPFEVDEKAKIKPVVMDIGSKKYKFYIERLAYPWKQGNSKGISHAVRLSMAKLDRNGDLVGNKKGLGLPAEMTDKQLSELFNAVIQAKATQPVITEDELKEYTK